MSEEKTRVLDTVRVFKKPPRDIDATSEIEVNRFCKTVIMTGIRAWSPNIRWSHVAGEKLSEVIGSDLGFFRSFVNETVSSIEGRLNPATKIEINSSKKNRVSRDTTTRGFLTILTKAIIKGSSNA